MDDLEKAILMSFDESGGLDCMVKQQAIAYIHCIKENRPSVLCSVCVEKLCFSKSAEVQFWCLQCLHEVLRTNYSSMAAHDKSFIRISLFSMACGERVPADNTNSNSNSNQRRVLDAPAFVKNKLAQALVTLIYFDYPSVWPSLFLDFLPCLRNGHSVIDMFSRVLNALHDELIGMHYPRKCDEMTVSDRVKDAMMSQCVPQIVGAWCDVVLMYRNSDPELCSSVLDSMRRYVSWIDIGMVANDAVMGLLFELMLAEGLSDQLRAAATRVVLAVVSKRMDTKSKLSLLQSLQMKRVFRLVLGDTDPELVSSVASLLTGYATEILECSKHLKSEEGRTVSLVLLNEVLPSVFHVIQHCDVDSTFSFVQFFSIYVGTMKRQTVTEAQLVHVEQILEVIRSQIQFDPTYRNNLDVLDKVGQEEEDRMVEFRKDLFVLLRSVGQVAPDLTHTFIRNSLDIAASSPEDRNAEEVEASLSLFYALGESLCNVEMRNGCGMLGELVLMLLSTRFPCHSNRRVALVYLETITRYVKFVSENTQYVPMILQAFLDERCIRHPNVSVSRRASYLFTRVVKLLKGKLAPYIETLFQNLQDTIAQFTRMASASKELSGPEDGTHIFEAIGLLIGMEEVILEKQSDYLSALLTPLCQKVEAVILNAKSHNPEETLAHIENIEQIIMAINALSKGLSEGLVTSTRPGIGLMFKKTLDILLQILVAFPKIEPLRYKVTSFIYRMVNTLGESVFPYLQNALNQLLTESEPKDLVGFIVLVNQLICKFRADVRGILDEVYPVIASRVFNILPRNDIQSGQGSCPEELRELQDLQKAFFTFLHDIATRKLSLVFLSHKSFGYLDTMMQLLLHTCSNHKDITIRKTCVQIFIRLIKDWCTAGPCENEKVPGFKSFIIEAFAMNCCLYSVLDKSFEFRDANTGSLFSELVLAQKVMYEKFGNDFLLNFVSKGFSNVHCPQDLAEQYCQKLQGTDIKALKSFYKSLVKKLRQQQTGNLVTR